ncbi:MAG: GNAT family N-acetyltransferase [Pseudomonadales bacterium]|nr:GNAT family N-acetyltransferase [Pseudomonadales bacterium]
MTQITIRTATPDDAETIASWNQAMALETENKTLPTDTILPGVKRVFAEDGLGFYLMACIDDKPVGCLMITTEWSDWRNGLFWWIQSVYVAPEHREKGAFTALYGHVREKARANPDICGIRLYVEKENERASRTYLRLGMIETEYRLLEEEF